MSIVVAVFALLVAFQYFVIGFYVVPRMSRLVDTPGPLVRAAQWGASFFFVGCATTHVGVAIHSMTGDVAGYGNVPHTVIAHILPHIAQIAGGITFSWIVSTRLDVRFRDKEFATMEEEKEQLMARLQFLATHDHLTGLLNRRAFDQELAAHQRFGQRYGPTGGVIFLDLDGFKEANDTLGHSAGDLLLQQAATVLTKAVRDTDLVGRVGGDEFAVLLREAGPAEVEGTAERIIRELARIKEPTPLTASAGVATYADHPNAIDAADAAMYEAKRAGGDRYVAVRTVTDSSGGR